ncbi:ATP-binding protein [Nocardiopsis sp. FIRDI 009]|uniref:AAA family ATPase n=1 Tax=Nocardiopsis sp. FIRDI 009 TaxID=714197 RepID=UPI000E277B59|nr:ATP-binding protein [Nocardiopsis sp. FIRDI 009]
MLIVMSGLPGTGKSTLARALGKELGAPVLSVDPAEAAMRRSGVGRDQPTGLAAYVVVEALASDVLALGLPVIVDAVNDAREARDRWRGLADRHDRPLRFVHVVCSDADLHRHRLENRTRDLPGLAEPGWESVEARRIGFAGWTGERIVVDSVRPLADNVRAVVDGLAADRRTAGVREFSPEIADRDAGLLRRLAE